MYFEKELALIEKIKEKNLPDKELQAKVQKVSEHLHIILYFSHFAINKIIVEDFMEEEEKALSLDEMYDRFINAVNSINKMCKEFDTELVFEDPTYSIADAIIISIINVDDIVLCSNDVISGKNSPFAGLAELTNQRNVYLKTIERYRQAGML